MSKAVLRGANDQILDGQAQKSATSQILSLRVLEGIDNGLDSIGKNVKDVFYAEMEFSYKLKKEEIIDNPERFGEAIIKFFTVGAYFVERAIGREVLKMFDLPLSAGLNFRTSLEIVMRHPHNELQGEAES